MQIQKATKRKTRGRMALAGPSGSGKTMTALRLASGLGERIGLIDSEHGSAGLYSDRFDFDTIVLEEFEPAVYRDAIALFADAGHDVLVVDSLSHAWTQGALKMVDDYARRNKNDSFGAWREVTPEHNALVNALLTYPGHVIVTMRSKTEYVREEVAGRDGGKRTQIRKVGMAPVQRDGMEYEFDVVADLDTEHNMLVTKSRCPALSDKVIKKPDEKVAKTYLAWLEDGAPARADELRSELCALLIASRGKTVEEAKEATAAHAHDEAWLSRAIAKIQRDDAADALTSDEEAEAVAS